MPVLPGRKNRTPSSTAVDSPSRLVVVVLAGGRSLRMGQDKRELLLGGQSLIARCLDLVTGLGYPVLLANGQGSQQETEQPQGEAPENFGEVSTAGNQSPVEACPDGKGRGPAAGLLGAASQQPNRPLLAVACDLPFLSRRLLQALIARAEHGRADVVLPSTSDGLHPLVAYYSPHALKQLDFQVARGRFSLQALVRAVFPAANREGEQLLVDTLHADDLGFSEGALTHQLFNCNTPDDWQQARRRLEEG